MSKKYCNQCGQELDEAVKFCSSCGAKADSLEKETVGVKVDKVIDKIKSENGGNSNIKIIVGIIIALLAIVIVVFAFSGGAGLGSDLVDVTSVTLDHKYFYATSTFGGGTDDERPIKGIIEFSFMPTEYLERVTGIGLRNIQITYSDGQTQDAGSGVFNEYYNIYDPNMEYSYSMNYVVDLYPKAEDNINAYFDTTHIKADIVINTTSETNKVIGHIDSDVVPPSK